MNSSPQIMVTKLDAARRQLRTAIELWASDGDPVSIHSLAFAAHQIIHDLKHAPNRAVKGSPILLDNPSVRPEKMKDWVNLVKRDANFFKHADNRIKEKGKKESKIMEIEFFPETNDLFMLIAIDGLKDLVNDLTEIENAFLLWQIIQKPELMADETRNAVENAVPSETLNHYRSMKKKEFIERLIQIAHRNQ